jgi:ABC-type amino acid transport substrate-binding protein
MPLLFWSEIPKNIKNPEDLISLKKPLCVEAGSYQEHILSHYKGLPLKNVDRIAEALLEIKGGKSIALAVDPSLVPHLQAQFPQVRALYFDLPSDLQSLGNGICVHRERTLLSEQVRQAVEELKKEGALEALEKKWHL